MKSRFKKNDTVRDDCGCLYIIVKVGIKYYHYIWKNSDSDDDNKSFRIKIKDLDERAEKE